MYSNKQLNSSTKTMGFIKMESMKMTILEAQKKMAMAILGILLIKLFITPIIWSIWALLLINLMSKSGGGLNRKMTNLSN